MFSVSSIIILRSSHIINLGMVIFFILILRVRIRLLLRNRGFAVSLYVVFCPLWSALWFAVHNMGCSVLFRVLVWCYVCYWSCCRCCLGCAWLRGCVGVCCVVLWRRVRPCRLSLFVLFFVVAGHLAVVAKSGLTGTVRGQEAWGLCTVFVDCVV